MSANSERGYTLVELLVVLALLGFISLAMSGGIKFGGRLWLQTFAKQTAIDQVTATQVELRSLLQAIVPRDLDPGIPNDPALFRATRDKITFTAKSPSALDASGTARFEINRVRRADAIAMTLRWTPLSGPTNQTQKTLIADAAEISISFATLDQNGTFTWRDEWIDQSGVPSLIMIRVVPASTKSEPWPELIVRPRISREPSCIYDPVSFGCRHG